MRALKKISLYFTVNGKVPAILAAFLLSFCFITSCDTEEDEESVNRFVIISYGGPCEGYYLLDSDSGQHSFSVNEVMSGSSSNYYQYTRNLEAPDYLSIHIDFSTENTYYEPDGSAFSDPATSTVSIYIYSDDDIVDSGTYTRDYSDSDDSIFTITGDLSYDFDSDDDDE